MSSYFCGGSRHCLGIAFEFANRLANPSTLRGRRFAPEAWDDTEVIPPLANDRVTPCAKAARHRPSKINGRDAAPSGSYICGGSRPCLGKGVHFLSFCNRGVGIWHGGDEVLSF